MEICTYCEVIKKAPDSSVMLDSLEALDNPEALDSLEELDKKGMSVAREIADLFYQAVWAIDDELYSPEQKTVWAPEPDYELWQKRLAQKKPWLAIIDQRIAGFIELDPDGHIDCTYTHPDFQGRGVASGLYQQLEKEARSRGLERLYVEASLVAQPFFQRRGFTLVKENIIQRGGVTLSNFTMEKPLALA